VIEGALLREEELAKRIMKAETPGPVLMEREDRGKLSEEKSTKREGTMGCGRVSCNGENSV
jgi:hypothetical protein